MVRTFGGQNRRLRRFAKCFKQIRGISVLIPYWLRQSVENSKTGQTVVLDVREYFYARYFYSFVKFLCLEGFQVRMRPDPATLYALNRAQYGNLVLSEKLVKLSCKSEGAVSIGDYDSDKKLLPFDFDKSVRPGGEEAFDVPMAQHPVMYSRGYWNAPIDSALPRRNAIVFIGNPEHEIYSSLGSDGVFAVITRVRLWELLQGARRCSKVFDEGEISASREGVVLVDSRVCKIPYERFRKTVGGFRFFLCAPGAFMPLCHNLIEALSVGTIPVIEAKYASLLYPALVHRENAIVFKDEIDLIIKIEECLHLDDMEAQRLCANVLAYYEAYLTPAAVVRRVMDPSVKVVRMLAGNYSVQLFRERLARNA